MDTPNIIPIDHHLEIRFEVQPDNKVISSVWLTLHKRDYPSSVKFRSAPCATKTDATVCALMYIKEAHAPTSQVEGQNVDTIDMQAAHIMRLIAENKDLQQDSSRGLSAVTNLRYVKSVLQTAIEHLSGEGWRRPDVLQLLRDTMETL